MAGNPYVTDLGVIGEIVPAKYQAQPKWKEFSNTVTGIVGALVTIASFVVVIPLELPEWVYVIIVAITSLGTALGISQTKNGLTKSQLKKLEAWKADYIDKQHELHGVKDPTPEEIMALQEGRSPEEEEDTPAEESFGALTANDLRDMVERARRTIVR